MQTKKLQFSELLTHPMSLRNSYWHQIIITGKLCLLVIRKQQKKRELGDQVSTVENSKDQPYQVRVSIRLTALRAQPRDSMFVRCILIFLLTYFLTAVMIHAHLPVGPLASAILKNKNVSCYGMKAVLESSKLVAVRVLGLRNIFLRDSCALCFVLCAIQGNCTCAYILLIPQMLGVFAENDVQNRSLKV